MDPDSGKPKTGSECRAPTRNEKARRFCRALFILFALTRLVLMDRSGTVAGAGWLRFGLGDYWSYGILLQCVFQNFVQGADVGDLHVAPEFPAEDRPRRWARCRPAAGRD